MPPLWLSRAGHPKGGKTAVGLVSLLLLGLLLFGPSTQAQEVDRTDIAVEALTRLQNVDLTQNPKLKEAVLKVLERTGGTPNFVKLVRQFRLTDQGPGLLEVLSRNPRSEAGLDAARLLLAQKQTGLLQGALHGADSKLALALTEVLGNTSEKEVLPLLSPILLEAGGDQELKKQAVRALAKTPEGASQLLQLAMENKLADNLRGTAGAELNRARWPEIKAEAERLLPQPQGRDAQPLPSVSELSRRTGDPLNGARIFSNAAVACSTCHRVKGQGVDFGPNLSEVGTKLGKEALYESILDPSAGISFGYEAVQLQLKSGDEAYGLKASETSEEIAIKAVGGLVTRYQKSDIQRQEQLKLSIMPAGLQQTMTVQDLVDLVDYLSSLRKAP